MPHDIDPVVDMRDELSPLGTERRTRHTVYDSDMKDEEGTHLMTDRQPDIPQHAMERLKGLRGQGHPGGIFTSDFSVNEFLLVRKAGFEPVGLCVGSCIYHRRHPVSPAGARTRN